MKKQGKRALGAGLFGNDLGMWASDPRAAFDGWIAGAPARGESAFLPSSAKVYRAMFGKFAGFLEASGVSLLEARPEDIAPFFGDPAVNRPQRRRYALLLRRAYAHLSSLDPSIGNPAAAWIETAQEGDPNRPTPFLSEHQKGLARSIALAPLPAAAHVRRLIARDRALAAMLLGAGLKVGEALACSVNCADLGAGWVRVPSPPAFSPRRALLLPWAAEPIARWAEIGGLGPGDRLFPGQGAGGLSEAAAFRAVVRTIEESGADVGARGRLSPQTLRNAYASDLIERGESDEMLAQCLGYARVFSARRIRQAWKIWSRPSD